MPSFTKEQQEAIDKEGMNILVSAGAGSGKTAVLTERVLRKIKEGTSIDQLLILTFTNKAALEMKERIRKKLQKENLLEQLDLIDNSYITTFDAFSLAVVKKYADLLDIPKEISIAETSILKLKKQEILENIFNVYYKKPTENFQKMIRFFCLKDDRSIQKKILALDEKLELALEKEEILKNYCNDYYTDKNITSYIKQYENLIIAKKENLVNSFQKMIAIADDKYQEKLIGLLKPLEEAIKYEQIKKASSIIIPRLPNNSDEQLKIAKQEVAELLKQLQELTVYENQEYMYDAIKQTKPIIAIMLEILQKLNQQLNMYKKENNFYTFIDIEKMAIELVKTKEEARKELKDQFEEILIDEYQDTNDIQETFISYIAKNNVYMVGDIKQSIYRFRNANPKIFKNKYDKYKQGMDGYVIDLVKNFRSRREVLEDINILFSSIMDDNIGGAEYTKGHAMIFGNTIYEEKAVTKDNHHVEIYTYNKEDDESTKIEKEAFIIADDIKNKIKNNYLVYDKDQDVLRKATYQDFVILLDRSTDFITYQQIFEYLEIPLTRWQNESAISSTDIYIIKNFFLITTKIAKEEFDQDFFLAYASLARSFLFQYTDEKVYEAIINKKYKSTNIYQLFLSLAKEYDYLTPILFLEKVLEKVDYHSKLITLGNVKTMDLRMEYFYNLIKNLESLSYTMEDVTNYFLNVLSSNFDIELAMNQSESNSVKIMTIHKSKGLEYPICYFAGFTKKFNDGDYKESVLYDQEYGIIIPDIENDQELITRTMMLNQLKQEDIGEKIRLFYVALTRAREKMIIVIPEEENSILTEKKVEDLTRLKYSSFESIMKSVYGSFLNSVKKIETIPNFNKNYLVPKEQELFSLSEKKELKVFSSIYNEETYEKKRFSKEITPKIEDEKLMEYGRMVHELLERCDLKTKIIPEVDDSFLEKKLNAFIHHPFLIRHQQDKIYQEYEFYQENSSKIIHGKIDLLLVGKTQATIIDYKLKNIVDDAYKEQLSGYKKIINNKLNRQVNCYLYSILDEIFTEIDC